MPEISIIVPVYKAEKYLDRCVKSILRQTFTDFELILIDDGSPDKSGELCDAWARKDKRIRVIHQKNAGAGAARNAGLQIAAGKYIGFIDSDDWIEPVMYEVLHHAIVSHSVQMSSVQMINRTKYTGNNYTTTTYPIQIKTKNEMLARFFRIHGEDASINSVCIKLIARGNIKGFYFLEGTINEDVAANFYFITHCKNVAMIEAPLYNYFQNFDGVTKNHVTKKDFEYIDSYKKILDIVTEKYSDFQYYAYMNYIRAHFTILTKMKIYGYDKKDSFLKQKYQMLKKVVRKNFVDLMKWHMPISRKILLIILCM